jgi:hypothetical protein
MFTFYVMVRPSDWSDNNKNKAMDSNDENYQQWRNESKPQFDEKKEVKKIEFPKSIRDSSKRLQNRN